MEGKKDDRLEVTESPTSGDDPAIADDAVLVEAPSALEPDKAGKNRPVAKGHEAQQRPAPKRRSGVCLADGKVVDFDPGDLDLAVGDQVVVSNERDLNLGNVVYLAHNRCCRQLHRVLRKVGPHDLLLIRRNKKREEEAFEFCCRRIAERNLPMKLVHTAYLHGGNKAIFFFTAEGRVDFRALVRDLAQQLHVRIEMRQIGVRDEAKLLGGIGICGQTLCCERFLRKFVPVSIKMAKNQGLALNPQKVSGLCGRLMCCLVYEDSTYKELRKDFPRVGKTIDTPKGPGKVVEADVLAGQIRVMTDGGFSVFTLEQLRGDAPEPPTPEPQETKPQPRSENRPTAQAEAHQRRTDSAKAAESTPKGQRSRRRRRRRSNETGLTAAASDTVADNAQRVPQPSTKGEEEKKPPADTQAKPTKPQDASAAKRKKRSRRRSRRRRKRRLAESSTTAAGGQSSPDADSQ